MGQIQRGPLLWGSVLKIQNSFFRVPQGFRGWTVAHWESMRKACDVWPSESVHAFPLRVCIVFHIAVATAKALFQTIQPCLRHAGWCFVHDCRSAFPVKAVTPYSYCRFAPSFLLRLFSVSFCAVLLSQKGELKNSRNLDQIRWLSFFSQTEKISY